MSFLFVQEVAASSAAIIWKKKGKKEEKVEVKKETPYEKFFKGKKCETVKGLIILHKMDNKIYFELPLSLLGKDMLIGSTVTEITNNGFANVGEKPHEPMHVMFTRTDSTINLRQVTCAYMSKDRNLQERIKTSMMPAIIENLAIKAYSPDSTAVVIDMTNFLLSDNEQLNPFSAYAPVTWSGAWIEKEFKRNNSQIAKIKAFDDNVSVQSSLTYSVSLRDKRSYYWYKEPFTAVMTRTFLLLPEEPMRPRLADPRINIFWQGYSEFSNEGNGMKPLYYANRWRLEPKDEAAYRRGELVEPKKPIVFYIDNAFPEMWKPYMKYAVEVWQNQAQVNAAITRLNVAIENLNIRDFNKIKLQELVERTEKLSAKDYTRASWERLEKALSAAKIVLADEKATLAAVDEAKTVLQNALEQLEKVAISEESSQGVKTGDAANFAGIFALMVSTASLVLWMKRRKENN